MCLDHYDASEFSTILSLSESMQIYSMVLSAANSAAVHSLNIISKRLVNTMVLIKLGWIYEIFDVYGQRKIIWR